MVQDLLHAVVEDEEAFLDFRDALSDYAPRVESLVALLRSRPDSTDAMADLFRTIHNIKGDASLCRLNFLVPYVHAVENLLSRVRSGDVAFSSLFADVLLLSLDRLQLTVEVLASHGAFASLRLPEFTAGLEAMVDLAPGKALDGACRDLINTITGVEMPVDAELVNDSRIADEVALPERDASDDLAFFRALALQYESRSALFVGRTARNLRLALLINQLGNGNVDDDQLSAAVYMHDIGMMFLRESVWVGNAKLSEEEGSQMKLHAGWAAGMLQRIPGWDLAARIVVQHHEKLDGSGYPAGLLGRQIEPGAQILALVDAFEAVMVKQIARGQSHSILRAVAEVNASDRQFDQRWIEPFNKAIRQMLQNQG